MAKEKISGKELRAMGYPQGKVIPLVIHTMSKHFGHLSQEDMRELLSSVLQSPNQYSGERFLGPIAEALLPKPTQGGEEIRMLEHPVPFEVYGNEGIEEGALQQMRTAVRVPIAVRGALMPDAHSGYGLPIGGVLAARDAIIPYGVGVDIGCRMSLSVFDIDPAELATKESLFKKMLVENTLFGSGVGFSKPSEDDVLYDPLFRELPAIRGMREKAVQQLGSSGSGNHFVEWGRVEIGEDDPVTGLKKGEYLGLLSHSGSRGLGAHIANVYTKIAKEKRRLPSDASNLAWLELQETEGEEYWLAMNLAGNYASACHRVIHQKMAAALGRKPIAGVENHHNFAWKENVGGEELVVHRKGATPAGEGVMGIIPGSMSAPGFIVRGKGVSASIDSASHGAGRRMSRTAALNLITHKELDELLRQKGISLIGGGLDESPVAYKDIFQVMKAQESLVDTVGLFHPRIVRMDGAAPKPWAKKKK